MLHSFFFIIDLRYVEVMVTNGHMRCKVCAAHARDSSERLCLCTYAGARCLAQRD